MEALSHLWGSHDQKPAWLEGLEEFYAGSGFASLGSRNMGRRESQETVQRPVGDVRTVMRTIVHHLIRHPAAKDTAEGVRFWCDLYGVVVPCGVVQEALHELLRLELVSAHEYGDVRGVVYSRAILTEDGGKQGQQESVWEWTA